MRGKLLITVFMSILLGMVLLSACDDDDDGFNVSNNSDETTSDSGESTSSLDEKEFADALVQRWLDVDFSFNDPDGTSDTDSDGSVDTNDAVNFVETLSDLGYAVPPTPIQGLYENKYSGSGYSSSGYLSDTNKTPYIYTLNNPICQADLEANDWSGLAVGDLIFIDYDKDFWWDNAAVYLGAYDGMSHAVVFASDYYDKVVIEDLDESTAIIVQDIAYGYSDVKTPAYNEFAGN